MQRHPYITAAVISTILAIIVWWIVPDEYSATTRLSDENKETDLAIGVNGLSAGIKKVLGTGDLGINDIETYCRVLKTMDFAQTISRKQVPGKNMTYGRWVMESRRFWQTKDTLEAVSGNIEYNVSGKNQTLSIQFSDRDPLIAAQMLDSVTAYLQQTVTKARHQDAEIALMNLDYKLADAADNYCNAREKYAKYCDSHRDASKEDVLQHEAELKNEISLAHKVYKETTEQYTRQLALMQRDYNSFAVIKSNVVPEKDNSHPAAYIAVFIMIAFSVVKGRKLYRRRQREHARIEFGGLFSPWSVTLLVWGGLGLLYLVKGDILDPLTEQFYISIALWIPILVITSFVTFNLLRHDTRPLPTEGIDVNKSVFSLFFILAVVLSPLYMYKVYHLVSMFDSRNLMKSMRELAVFGSGMGILNYAMVISQSVMLAAFWRYPKIPLWQLAISILCCVISSLAIMEKGGLFLAILCGMYVLFERKIIKVRTIVTVVCLTVVGFYLFNLMREGADSDYSRNESLFDFIGMYVMSPSAAYCRVRREISSQFGANTFETIYLFLQRFGFNVEVHSKVQEFVFVPISTNVYTVMQPFFRDFGYVGVAFFAWLYGLVSGFLYRLSSNGNNPGIVLYTYMVYVLALQFYQENIFLSMVTVIQLTFFIALYTVKGVRLSVRRKGGHDEI